MFFQKYLLEDILTRFEIYQQFYKQTDQLYIYLRALFPTISTMEMNLFFLLSLKSLLGKFYFGTKFYQLPIYQLSMYVNYNVKTITWKKRLLIFNTCDLNKKSVKIKNMVFDAKSQPLVKLSCYSIQRKKRISQKLRFEWINLCRISNTVKDKSAYMFKELDRLQLAGIFAGN